MLNLRKDLEELLKKYPDPRKGGAGLLEFEGRELRANPPPRYGIVSDNKDPRCLGRLRVACDMIAPGAVTDWIPMVNIGATKGTGWWQLPDIGTQVLLAFVGNCINRPVVLGCIHDLKHKPPEHSTKKAADSILYQTKSHRMEIIDEEGKEAIIISTAKGKMRYTLTSGKGIEVINELGDIQIKCRELTIEGGEDIQLQGKKKVSIIGEDAVSIHAKKNIKLSCDKEIKMKGENINLNAIGGITTEGKQLAAEGDKVMGFDIHNREVPAGTSTAVVPLPHPYIGKMADNLSDNVKINGHNAATEGSKSKHDHPVHNQLPGTIKFVNNPNKEGEVTGGTGKKVKINGKEVAVIGSTVTTCNDIGARDNSTILAMGASMPMPVIINPKNMKEYQEERAKQNPKKPEFTAAKWGKGTAKEGEKAELSAQVKDIDDGNMVTFQVWKEGQDPNSHIAQAQLPTNIEGGTAKAQWQCRPIDLGDDPLPEADPQFFFTVHSAWCPYKKSSGMVTVELKRPELSNPAWQDQDGKGTDKGLVGEALKMAVSCNGDMEEGAGVTFRVYADGANPKRDRPVWEQGAANQGGKAEAEWVPREMRKPGDTTELKYFFTATAKRAKPIQSDSVSVKNPQIIEIFWDPEIIYHGDEAILKIKTFEVSEFNPTVKVQLWEKEENQPETFISEYETIIDKDEIKIDIDTFLKETELYAYKKEGVYTLHAKIVCEALKTIRSNTNILTIHVENIYG